jgi:hypothetical protein
MNDIDSQFKVPWMRRDLSFRRRWQSSPLDKDFKHTLVSRLGSEVLVADVQFLAVGKRVDCRQLCADRP